MKDTRTTKQRKKNHHSASMLANANRDKERKQARREGYMTNMQRRRAKKRTYLLLSKAPL